MKSGIYMIQNLITRKVYVGSSTDMLRRWKQHKRELNNNSHHSFHLQNSWNKYGNDVFQFSVLEKVEREFLQEKEVYWCDTLKAHDHEFGYNIAAVIRNGNISKDHTCFTENFKKSQSSKTTNKKRIWLTSKTGVILNTFESRVEAAKILNTQLSNISFLISGKTQVFNNEFMLWGSLSFTDKKIKEKLSKKQKQGGHNQKAIYQFSSEGLLLNKFSSIKEAISETQISNLAYLMETGVNCVGGCLYSFNNQCPSEVIIKKNSKIIYQYSLDKVLLNKFTSVPQAALLTNSKPKGISKVLYKERNHHNQFIWTYIPLTEQPE